MNHDMKHMNHLENVVSSDVAVLRRKEATYQGSWKRAGGRSAWFMLRRNMDRLLEMMKRPETPHGFSLEDLDDVLQGRDGADDVTVAQCVVKYMRDSYLAENIFAKIREKPDGADGTVLACMRDLRRYLTLVEAEMVARGVVTPESIPGPAGLPGRQGVSGRAAEERETRRVPRFENSRKNPEMSDPDDGTPKTRKPDVDESRHASLVPWQVEEVGGDFLMREFYRHAAPKVWRLEPFVVSKNIPRAIAHCYDLSGHAADTWILKMQDVPDELRECYPRLQLELNAKEHEEHPQKFMYWLDSIDGKYKLTPRHVEHGWGRGA